MEKWKLIFTTQDPLSAQILKGNLEEHGVNVQILQSQDSLLHQLIPGNIKLFVPEGKMEEAKQIIETSQKS